MKMKLRFLWALPLLLILFAPGARAQCPSQTPNIGFQIPNIGNTTTWGLCINGDLSTLDNLLGGSATFPIGTTTPAINQHTNWSTANVSPVTVTNITGGFSGQTLKIICGVSDTFTAIATSATISLSAPWNCSTSKALSLTFIGTVWYETSRQLTLSSPVTGCSTNGGVAFENGSSNQLTCNGNFKYSPTGTWWEISQNGSDNTTIEGNMAVAGQPLLQFSASTAGPLGSSFQLDAFNHLVEFGPGGTNYATAIEGQSQTAGVPLASTGTYRMSKASTECWKNNANTADLCVGINASDQLTYKSVPLAGTGTSFASPAVSNITNTLLGLTQNNTLLASFYLGYPVTTLSRMQFDATLADNSANNYDFGVYGPNCTNSATNVPLVFHTGVLAGSVVIPSTGAKNVALAGAPVTVNMVPGWYCVAYTSDGATPAGSLGGDSVSIHVLQFANATAPAGGTGATTAGTLNSTITAPALSFSGGTSIFVTAF